MRVQSGVGATSERALQWLRWRSTANRSVIYELPAVAVASRLGMLGATRMGELGVVHAHTYTQRCERLWPLFFLRRAQPLPDLDGLLALSPHPNMSTSNWQPDRASFVGVEVARGYPGRKKPGLQGFRSTENHKPDDFLKPRVCPFAQHQAYLPGKNDALINKEAHSGRELYTALGRRLTSAIFTTWILDFMIYDFWAVAYERAQHLLKIQRQKILLFSVALHDV